MIRWVTAVAILLATFVNASVASADDVLLVVTEQTAEVGSPNDSAVDSYWWGSDTEPMWTPTDIALRDALASHSIPTASVSSAAQLSRVYRRPLLTDSNAVAMASVFGASRVLIGVVRYEPTTLNPPGLPGWRAVVDCRLLNSRTSEVLAEVRVRRARWAPNDDEALTSVRTDVTRAVAQSIGASLVAPATPTDVGFAHDELMLGIQAATTRPALDEVRQKLETIAGVTGVVVRWATQGMIVMEVNPGAADARASLEQVFSLLTTEGTPGYLVVPAGEPRFENVLLVRLDPRESQEGVP